MCLSPASVLLPLLLVSGGLTISKAGALSLPPAYILSLNYSSLHHFEGTSTPVGSQLIHLVCHMEERELPGVPLHHGGSWYKAEVSESAVLGLHTRQGTRCCFGCLPAVGAPIWQPGGAGGLGPSLSYTRTNSSRFSEPWGHVPRILGDSGSSRPPFLSLARLPTCAASGRSPGTGGEVSGGCRSTQSLPGQPPWKRS